jgi:hypothetical protein
LALGLGVLFVLLNLSATENVKAEILADELNKIELPPCKGGPNRVPGPPTKFIEPGSEPKNVCVAEPAMSQRGPLDKRPVRIPGEDAVPTPGYHATGAHTTVNTLAIYGALLISDPGVRRSTTDFFAARFLEAYPSPTRWIEVGWAEVGWRGDDQYIYVYDTQHNVWHFYDQYPINPGDWIWVELVQCGGTNWCAYLYWNGAWNLLHQADVDFITADWVEEYGEEYTPDGIHFSLPPSWFKDVKIWTNAWKTWDTSISTTTINSNPPYDTHWVNEYYYWYTESH